MSFSPSRHWAGLDLTPARGPHAPLACVVTGVDDGAGEELATLALARTLRGQGLSVAVMTPAIRSDTQAPGRWSSAALQRLAASGSFRWPESVLCPYRLPPAPDLASAAAREGVVIDPEVVADACEVLGTWVDALVVMGMGGLGARLGPDLCAGQLFDRLALPWVLVRAAQRPCAGPNLLGAPVAGWLETGEPRMPARGTLAEAGAPRLGSVHAVQPAPLLHALRAAALGRGADRS